MVDCKWVNILLKSIEFVDGRVNKSYQDTYEKYMFDSEIRLPVLLQRVDADLSVRRHIRMEDLGEEERLGRRLGEVFSECQLHLEETAHVRST